ncbi:MAG TPA: magnesium transporter CorA family protein [Polyangiaceae bacterium]
MPQLVKSRFSLAPSPEAGSEASECQATLVEFDFGGGGSTKSAREIGFHDYQGARDRGCFVWLDLDAQNPREARSMLQSLGIADTAIDEALTGEPSTQHARYDDYLHLVVSGCREQDDNFVLERVDVFVAEHFMITLHRGSVVFLQAIRRDYKSDFLRFAKSPSFLVYELWDHLVDNYLSVQKSMEERVEQVQNELRADEVDDNVFARMSELGADLLHFRKILLPARAVLTDLSTRRSLFISEATQSFLANMAGRVEHVLQDLLVDREILSESLNLYMSLVSHRTNLVMKRLTVVSVVFLPLTFLVGVYGMNFDTMPELRWHYGYALFWGAAVTLVVSLVFLMRKAKLL